MSRSAWFSHVRLWICLALLLATNLANVIDGFELADVAKCVCEEAGLDANGVQFFSTFRGRIGGVYLVEDEVRSVRVEQATPTPQSVDWNVSGEIAGLTTSLLSRQGVSTTLHLRSSEALAAETAALTQGTITVSFEEDSGETFAENLGIELKGPRASIFTRKGYTRAILRSGIEYMFELNIRVFLSRNPDRDWQVVSFFGLPPGFEAGSPEKKGKKTFVLPLRGVLPAAGGSQKLVRHCSTLVVELMDENFGTTLRADLPFYAVYDETPPEGCMS